MIKLLLDILLVIVIFLIIDAISRTGYFRFEIDIRPRENTKEVKPLNKNNDEKNSNN